jgi:hypothetical protein
MSADRGQLGMSIRVRETRRNNARAPSVDNRDPQGTPTMTLGTDTLWNSTSYWSEPAERAAQPESSFPVPATQLPEPQGVAPIPEAFPRPIRASALVPQPETLEPQTAPRLEPQTRPCVRRPHLQPRSSAHDRSRQEAPYRQSLQRRSRGRPYRHIWAVGSDC